MEEIKNVDSNAVRTTINKSSKKVVLDDPVDNERREKVKEAMIHAWSSYEKYAWGQDELQVQNKILKYEYMILFHL